MKNFANMLVKSTKKNRREFGELVEQRREEQRQVALALAKTRNDQISTFAYCGPYWLSSKADYAISDKEMANIWGALGFFCAVVLGTSITLKLLEHADVIVSLAVLTALAVAVVFGFNLFRYVTRTDRNTWANILNEPQAYMNSWGLGADGLYVSDGCKVRHHPYTEIKLLNGNGDLFLHNLLRQEISVLRRAVSPTHDIPSDLAAEIDERIEKANAALNEEPGTKGGERAETEEDKS